MDIAAEVLYPAVDDLAPRLSAGKLEKSLDAALYPGGVDSINLVTFIALVEERLEEKTGRPVRLVTEKAMARKSSPFRTLGTLADYIAQVLGRER